MSKPHDPRRDTFLLPALSLPTSSLTDGTDIPPPPREPTPPPQKPNLTRINTSPLSSHPPDGTTPITATLTNGALNGTTTNGTNGVDSRIGSPNGTHGDANGMLSPKSPTSTEGGNSVRRFLSRNSLNKQYRSPTGLSASASLASVNKSAHPPTNLPPSLNNGVPGRPDSSLSFVSVGGTKRKKRSWWARLMGKGEEEAGQDGKVNGSAVGEKRKRGSVIHELDEPEGEKGPKAPRLPELRGLSRDGRGVDGLGEDMFRDIR